MSDDKKLEFRTGPTPTHGWYWFPHVVFPIYWGWVTGCIAFWGFGYKLEIQWDFRSNP